MGHAFDQPVAREAVDVADEGGGFDAELVGQLALAHARGLAGVAEQQVGRERRTDRPQRLVEVLAHQFRGDAEGAAETLLCHDQNDSKLTIRWQTRGGDLSPEATGPSRKGDTRRSRNPLGW